MHESSLARSVLDAVLRLAAEQGAERVLSVAGELSETEHLHSDAIQFHFDAHARGTLAEGARLALELVHVAARCRGCGARYLPEHHVTLCPECGSVEADLLGSPGLRLSSLEIE
jgi:hydrogenase nickel incorporation protein HypA/HybF